MTTSVDTPNPAIVTENGQKAPASKLDFALFYAKHGFRVFPCYSINKYGMCSCGQGSDCTSPGKHPASPNGCKDATKDAKKITKWWAAGTTFNVGLATGEGLLVIDVDPRHGGTLEALGPLPDTLMAYTGGGGYHLYFKHDKKHIIKNSTNKLAQGIDTRGDGGYVLAPPSTHVSGGTYTWANNKPTAQLPARLLHALISEKVQAPKTDSPETAGLETYSEGGRNDRLFKQGAMLRKKGLQDSEIEAALQAMNAARCIPPLTTKEVQQIVKSITRYAVGADVTAEAKKAEPYKRHVKSFDEYEEEEITYMWDRRVAYGKLTLFIGDGELGKSLVTLALAAALSKGEGMPDSHPIALANTLIIASEDGAADTIKPRLIGAKADLKRVFNLSMIEELDKETGETYERPIVFPDDAALLEDVVIEKGIKLIVLDPLLGNLSGNTDSHKDQDARRALQHILHLANEHKCAVIGIMHVNKGTNPNPKQRALGTVGWVNMSRAAHLFVPDPDNVGGVVMVSIKNNLYNKRLVTALRYEITTDEHKKPYVRWLGASTRSYDELVAMQVPTAVASEGQQAILSFVRGSERPVSIKEVADEVEKSYDAVEKMLNRLVAQSVLIKPSRGLYTGVTTSSMPL